MKNFRKRLVPLTIEETDTEEDMQVTQIKSEFNKLKSNEPCDSFYQSNISIVEKQKLKEINDRCINEILNYMENENDPTDLSYQW